MNMAKACCALISLVEAVQTRHLPQRDSLSYSEDIIISELNEVMSQYWYILNIRHFGRKYYMWFDASNKEQ